MNITWIHYSPALHNIGRHLAPRVIKEKWHDTIAPIMWKEDQLYVTVFEAVGIVWENNYPICVAKDLFLGVAGSKGLIVPAEPTIPNMVFDIYSDLAQHQEYWKPGQSMKSGGHLPFEMALARWRTELGDTIRWQEENLRQWLRES